MTEQVTLFVELLISRLNGEKNSWQFHKIRICQEFKTSPDKLAEPKNRVL